MDNADGGHTITGASDLDVSDDNSYRDWDDGDGGNSDLDVNDANSYCDWDDGDGGNNDFDVNDEVPTKTYSVFTRTKWKQDVGQVFICCCSLVIVCYFCVILIQ